MTYGFTSTLLHSDRRAGIEHGSVHKPIHNSVLYGYDDARQLAAVFQGREAGYSYGRQINPTVTALQNKVTQMEDGVATVCFATGMAAIGSVLFALLRAGDHVIASEFLFGNSRSLLESFALRGLEVSFVDACSAASVQAQLRENTRLVLVETVANPRTQVADLENIGALCSDNALVYVVDNTMTSPFLLRPKQLGASLVVNSLSKYIGGHGNALGGAVTDTGLFDWSAYNNIDSRYRHGDRQGWGILQIRKKGLRDFGASLCPDAAHRLAVGAETLALRMERACANAQALAEFLSAQDKIKRVYYPGLPDHPQYLLAKQLFRRPGALLSFELDDSIDCFDFLNRLQLVICSSHLGDTRTLAIPVAHSIFHELGRERRAAMGISDSLLRVSVGIEDCEDLLQDFEQAL